MTNIGKTDDLNKRSFSDAYGVLQRHAETLRDQAEPIDDLLTIGAAERASDAPTEPASRTARQAPPPAEARVADDDIPF